MSNSERSLRIRLAEELRAEMARQGMSYRRMAESIGRPHNTVSHWLNGESAIDPDILESICNALGMETPDLYASARRNGGWTVQMPPVRPRPTGKTGTPSRSLKTASTGGCVRSTRRYRVHGSRTGSTRCALVAALDALAVPAPFERTAS